MGIKSIGVITLFCIAAFSLPLGSAYGSDLKLLVYSDPLSDPSGAVLIDSHTALVSQRNDGKVLLLRDGKVIKTVLDLPVANRGSQGLIDIAMGPKFSKYGYIYLLSTPSYRDGRSANSEVLNRYKWDGKTERLVFDKTVAANPKDPRTTEVGGSIAYDFPQMDKPVIYPSSPGSNVVTVGFPTSNHGTGVVRLVDPYWSGNLFGLISRTTLQKHNGGSLSFSYSDNSSLSYYWFETARLPKSGSLVNVQIVSSHHNQAVQAGGTFSLSDPLGPHLIDLISIRTLTGNSTASSATPIISTAGTLSGGTLSGGHVVSGQVQTPITINSSLGGIVSFEPSLTGAIDYVDPPLHGGATIDLSGAIAAFNQGTLTLPSISIPPNPDPAAGGTASLEAPPTVVPTSLQVTVTPEPGSLALGILGLSATLLRRRARS